MVKTVDMGGVRAGAGEKVVVIAELGINHNGDIRTAKKLMDKAASAGVDMVKLQTYITEKRVAEDSPIFGILKQCELSFAQQKELFQYGRDKGVIVFSTPFDDESVDFLCSVKCPVYKIASFDLVNKKLLKKVAAMGKPVVMSRGMADRREVDTAVGVFKRARIPLVLLHCISAYPVTDVASLNLSTIRALEERYGCPVGYSDHTLGIDAAVASVAAGAMVIEKHFTLSRKAKGPDHGLSTEPAEMKRLVDGVRRMQMMMGSPAWVAVAEEKGILQYRRPS
jgi:N,N'-diacetyllegionaminate synthase